MCRRVQCMRVKGIRHWPIYQRDPIIEPRAGDGEGQGVFGIPFGRAGLTLPRFNLHRYEQAPSRSPIHI
jgi:hypothetical protein